MTKAILGGVVAAILFLGSRTFAIFLPADLEQVPVERLITNLQTQVEANPENWQPHYALGRVYSMAYALKQGTLPVSKTTGKVSSRRGPDREWPPSAVFPAPVPSLQQQAQKHLNQAIASYRTAVELNPEHAEAQLGLGWCLDQKGEKEQAKEAYRKALVLAWKKDQEADHFFYSSLTEEIARYLLALLDPKVDAEEISKVQGYLKVIRQKPRAVTPILVPVSSGHTKLEELIEPEANVAFDLDGSGLARHWGWISPWAAWLVFDPHGAGQVTSGLHMAGSVMFWIFWENGYQALGSLDADGDGELRGSELAGLALWQDLNQNGLSESGEVRSLSHWGVEAVSCNSVLHSTGVPYSPQGVRLESGEIRPSYDWILRSKAE